MARYRITARTFIDGALREEGEIVDYAGQPGSTLEPVDAPRRRALKGRRARDPAPAVLPPTPRPAPTPDDAAKDEGGA